MNNLNSYVCVIQDTTLYTLNNVVNESGRLKIDGELIFKGYILLPIEVVVEALTFFPKGPNCAQIKEETKTGERGLTSVHCPLFCTMSMTHGSDLFSVSRSSRALQDTRSSTLETQVAGPLRLVAGEVAS